MIGLPYFQFHTGEWQNGDITLESYELQGLFINVCSFYWSKECSIAQALLKKRFRDDLDLIAELIDLGIFSISEDDQVCINFLDIQFFELQSRHEKRVRAGRKGGKAKPKQCLSNDTAGLKQLEEKRIEENRIDILSKDNKDSKEPSEKTLKAQETKKYNLEFSDKIWPMLEKYPSNGNFDSAKGKWLSLRKAGYQGNEIWAYYKKAAIKDYGEGSQYVTQFYKAATLGNLKNYVKGARPAPLPNLPANVCPDEYRKSIAQGLRHETALKLSIKK